MSMCFGFVRSLFIFLIIHFIDAIPSHDVYTWPRPLVDKKQHAQHAAAARALDCLSYREGKGVRTMAYGLCDDEPYMSKEDASPLPSCAPTLLLESKAELLVKQHAIVEEKSEGNCVENERIEDRETYRQSRVSSAADMDDAETNLNADDA